jgi:hypothetical protein
MLQTNTNMAQMVQSIVLEQRLKHSSATPTNHNNTFWGEALSSFIHIHNRVTTIALPDSTPYQSLLRSKPDLFMLCVWGCTAYVLIQKDKRPLRST